MTEKPSKKTVKKHVKRLVTRWSSANELAWSTVGRPGPVFTNTTPGPEKDRVWEEFNDDLAADRAAAGTLYRVALDLAPVWLKTNKALVDKCFDRAFKGFVGPGIH